MIGQIYVINPLSFPDLEMMETEEELKKDLGEKLKINEPLNKYNSIGVGGVADFFFEATTVDDLVKVAATAFAKDVPYFILGGGNDTLPSNSGYSGLVIKNSTRNIVFSGSCSEVIVDSGVEINNLINLAASRDLGGLEFLAGQKGTVGGAIIGNFGSKLYRLNDFVKSITLSFIKYKEQVVANFPADRITFSSKNFGIKGIAIGYSPIILTVRLQLVRRRKDEILELISLNLKDRVKTFGIESKAITEVFLDHDFSGYSVGEILDSIKARKTKVGGAAVSGKNANVIVNYKNAQASDIRKLIQLLKFSVHKKHGLELKERIEYFGRW